jgi:hypothetical protein
MTYNFKKHLRNMLTEQKKAKGLLKEQNYVTGEGDTLRRLLKKNMPWPSRDGRTPRAIHNYERITLGVRTSDNPLPRFARGEEILDHPIPVGIEIWMPPERVGAGEIGPKEIPGISPEAPTTYKDYGFLDDKGTMAKEMFIDWWNSTDVAAMDTAAGGSDRRQKPPIPGIINLRDPKAPPVPVLAVFSPTKKSAYVKKYGQLAQELVRELEDKFGRANVHLGTLIFNESYYNGKTFTANEKDKSVGIYPFIERGNRWYVWSPRRGLISMSPKLATPTIFVI